MTTVGDEAGLAYGVETIDVWFSQRRQAWIVERIDALGNQVGAAHLCLEEADVAACITEWLRSHEGVKFVSPFGGLSGGPVTDRRRDPRRHAA